MKNYPNNGHITTLFITCVWVNNIILIGLLIGLSYYKMKKLMFQEIEKVYENQDKVFVYEKMLDYPDTSKIFVKKALFLHMDEKNPLTEEEFKEKIKEHVKKDPKIVRASEDIFWNLKQSFEYELIFSIVNLVIMAVAIQVIHIRDFSKYHYFIIMIALCCLSLFDFFNNLFFFDVTFYDRMWKTLFDTILNVAIILLSLMLLLTNLEASSIVKMWAFLCLAKQFRFFLLIFKFNRQEMRSHVIYPFTRYALDVFGLVMVLYIIFGSITLNLYGGNIHSYTMDNYNTILKRDHEYHYLNFNTIINSWVTLFVVMMNNNWAILANLSVIADIQKKQIMKFTFIIFKFLVNYIFINSLIAFTIQIFSEYDQNKVDKRIIELKKLAGKEDKENDVQDADHSDVFEEGESDNEQKK